MPITIKDVAKLANVSPSTVSRVLADNPKISDATKEKVYRVMDKLEYKPNQIARSLANKSTKTLGLLLSNTDDDLFQNPFSISLMKGISMYARKKGYFIMYTYSNKENEEVDVLRELVQSKWVDGIILTTVRQNDKCIEFLRNEKHPFVVIGKPDDNIDDILWVNNDNVGAMYNVVKTLIEKKHKKIIFIGGKKEFTVTKHRLDGYKKALNEYNIEFDNNLIFEIDYEEEKSYLKMLEIINSAKNIDAVVTTDDIIAFGVQRALQESGNKEIAVVGFNNTLLSRYKEPSLSTVDIHTEELGYNAVRLLIDYLEYEMISSYLVETELIIRDSIIDK